MEETYLRMCHRRRLCRRSSVRASVRGPWGCMLGTTSCELVSIRFERVYGGETDEEAWDVCVTWEKKAVSVAKEKASVPAARCTPSKSRSTARC
jgi:hypothetical protein